MGRQPNSREVILNAAEMVVVEVGAAHLTLDAVAQKAVVSKGGLLYNFPTKGSLHRAGSGLQPEPCSLNKRYPVEQSQRPEIHKPPGSSCKLEPARSRATL